MAMGLGSGERYSWESCSILDAMEETGRYSIFKVLLMEGLGSSTLGIVLH